MSNDPRSEHVAALARGLRVLEVFSREQPEMTLSEVARAVGTSPATARRCLLTLVGLGYVRQVGRRFVLTARVLSLGGAFADSTNLREVVQPNLQRLVDRFESAASMTILQGNDVLYIAHVASAGRSFARHCVGARLPAHATSSGHVLLAHQPPAMRDAYLEQAPFPRYTTFTPVTREDLVARFDDALTRGHAAVQDTVEYGAVALAVPVRDARGHVVAAVNTSASSASTSADGLVAERLGALRDAVVEIERALERFPTLARSLH